MAATLLRQQFEVEGPNQRSVRDTTELITGSSAKLYLAAIVDLFSRLVVGWVVSALNDRHPAIKALEMALKRRCPDVGLLHLFGKGQSLRERGLPDMPAGGPSPRPGKRQRMMNSAQVFEEVSRAEVKNVRDMDWGWGLQQGTCGSSRERNDRSV